MKKKTQQLQKIKEEVVNLEESPLYEYRTDNNYLPVLGEGSHDTSLMFVGEAPGEDEAKTGRPFCGRAGQILNNLLQEVDIKRENTYITNVVKDRPPDNRDPLPEEIEIYGPFLNRQIDIINPDILATLGRFAANYILNQYNFGEDFAISKIHGDIYKVEDKGLQIFPCFHPAASIYSNERREVLEKDFKKLKQLYQKTKGS